MGGCCGCGAVRDTGRGCGTLGQRLRHDRAWSTWQLHWCRPLVTDGPTFQNPPVAEVALGLYFAAPLGLHAAQMGQLWDRWRDRYPKTEDHPPLPPVMQESFPAAPVGFAFQLTGAYPGVRVWYVSDSSDRVVQVQQDRLVL